MAKLKAGGILKKTRSITGKTFTKPSIKPQNTRKIIRRFHLLINKKNLIYQKLSNQLNNEINDQNIESFNKTGKESTNPTVEELLNVSNENSLPSLFKLLRKIDYEIVETGGLQKYQIASLHGQESKRGSDSSKWLFDNLPELKSIKDLSALEIGSLSTKNVISKFAQTTRIDLNSNEPGILKQDFMERPTPKESKDRFNIVSCSLVLNFVPNARDRGKMMQRFQEFLKKDDKCAILFIVLPLSCITNSRYCDKDLFTNIVTTLGFEIIKYHEAKKLVYVALKWTGKIKKRKFPKVELHDGPSMNNFCIIIE
ncbi:hypothetical protein WICMUC_000845 [Wickerhamomyces mucosus]|uniref:25S rRNA adenine-N(1) methyltransferase n=1 Tax=Wickerhamomyces mucosus TaxID=1378264 RepID=A0A9P8PWH8_9ASCO|nr:hypothetical protein WICMUC_000845 [Wickerhamomyces mucosus]